jgi:hypothetical protein
MPAKGQFAALMMFRHFALMMHTFLHEPEFKIKSLADHRT